MKENEDIAEANVEVKKLKRDFKILNIMFLVFLVVFGSYVVISSRKETTLANKMIEISHKANVEVEATTNTLFGVLTKVRIVK